MALKLSGVLNQWKSFDLKTVQVGETYFLLSSIRATVSIFKCDIAAMVYVYC